MNAGEHLSVADALEEIGRMNRTVGRKARSSGWVFLLWGILSALYWSAMFFGSEVVIDVAVAVWVGWTALTFVHAFRQGVQGLGHMRTQCRVAFVWLVVFAGAAFFNQALPPEPSGWWIPAGLAVAVATALPMLYAAGKLRPWEGER
ncbi:hypothetical protein [Sphaerisporangium fuscum]|uniref:hypothetical protein n=1 Tax=Sphaerisporangium fuscum TaxID=2835868 RepID=UPI001BDD6016|nr:hypothetical protein [Sphaerisporangium fuscum]